MAAIRSKNTKPEIVVRRLLHAMGYRYRLNDHRLPGRPDIVFQKRKTLIWIHGCFWHGHRCPRGARIPKSNAEYWGKKLARNKERDAANLTAASEAGWKALVVWECEIRDPEKLRNTFAQFLGKPRSSRQ